MMKMWTPIKEKEKKKETKKQNKTTTHHHKLLSVQSECKPATWRRARIPSGTKCWSLQNLLTKVRNTANAVGLLALACKAGVWIFTFVPTKKQEACFLPSFLPVVSATRDVFEIILYGSLSTNVFLSRSEFSFCWVFFFPKLCYFLLLCFDWEWGQPELCAKASVAILLIVSWRFEKDNGVHTSLSCGSWDLQEVAEVRRKGVFFHSNPAEMQERLQKN